MKNTGTIIIVSVLILAIIVVVWMQQSEKNSAIKARQQQSQNEAAIALAYLNYANTQQQIDAQESAGVGDWLSTIGSIGSAVSSIFGAGIFGGGGGAGAEGPVNT